MIILASQSSIRKKLLTAAGVVFTTQLSPLNEAALQSECKDLTPTAMATTLALAKANALAPQHITDLVIGVDQTLEFEAQILHKPKTLVEAKQQLLGLQGKSHMLHTAYAIVRNEHSVAKYCDTSIVTMRSLTESFVDEYLLAISDTALSSVGCYQLEGLGIQLMEDIRGDYFSILGLPLLPLLKDLRQLGAIT
jgi:septum formation protein